MTSGRELKEEGISRALGNPSAAPWRAVAREALLQLIKAGDESFTSEDVTDIAGQPPHPNQVGALFSGAARRGWIIRTGFINAERANQHAALISVWAPTALGRVEAARVPFRSPTPIKPQPRPYICPETGCGLSLGSISTGLAGYVFGVCPDHGRLAVRA
jgi:hypothetical protein